MKFSMDWVGKAGLCLGAAALTLMLVAPAPRAMAQGTQQPPGAWTPSDGSGRSVGGDQTPTPTPPGGGGISRPGPAPVSPGGGGGGAAPVPPPPPPGMPPTPPPPPPQEAAMAVYIAVNGQTTGPFNRAELQAKAASGELNANTMIWQEGMAAWLPAGQVPAVAVLLPAPTPGGKPGDPITDFDPSRYIVGTWRAAPGSEIFVAAIGKKEKFTSTQIFRADGTLSGEAQMDTVFQGQPMRMYVRSEATYTLTRSGGTSFILSPRGQSQLIVSGLPPQVMDYFEPSNFTVIDQNTMRDTNGVTWMRS